MQLFEREIGREVLFGDRGQGAFRFGKNGVGRANPDAVQQSVDRQQPFRFVERVLERIERTRCPRWSLALQAKVWSLGDSNP